LIVYRFASPELIEGRNTKNRLMISRTTLNRIIVIGFMVLIGFSLAKAIYHKSFMGITLAFVSLGAAIYFLYILAKAKEEMETEEAV
jgi:Na+/H+ antiporter NhaD/arsenite permease-like protein